MNGQFDKQLLALQQYFTSGATKSFAFRQQQLLALKKAILLYEEELQAALFSDLKKSAEESWVTEVGFVISEINHTLKHLKKWMQRERVPTNLLNFPSRSFIYKEPLGVVLIIGPWNYPFQLLFAPLIGAIAAGNVALLKPSEFAAATAVVMEKIISHTFDPDYVMYVQGSGAEVVPQLMNNFRFDHVFYTGSTAVGKLVYAMAAKNLVPVTLELGGKSPCIIDETANIKIAARRIALTKFSNAGQMCVAPDYALVHHSVKAAFTQALIEAIEQFYSGNPADSYSYGKIINKKQFQRLQHYLQQATILYGGNYNEDLHYIQPTLLEDINLHTAIMGDEIFGPLLPIITYTSFEEAKGIISLNANPLAFYVFTENKAVAEKWLNEVSFGGGCVNNASFHVTNPNLPFGGRGNSGVGAYHGQFSFHVFSHKKAVMKTPSWFDPAVKYPPFKGKLSMLKKIIK